MVTLGGGCLLENIPDFYRHSRHKIITKPAFECSTEFFELAWKGSLGRNESRLLLKENSKISVELSTAFEINHRFRVWNLLFIRKTG